MQSSAATLRHYGLGVSDMAVAVAATSDDVKEILNDRAKFAELAQDKGAFEEWVEGSIQARIKNDPQILEQITDQTEKFAIAYLREQAKGSEAEIIAKRLNLDSPNARGPIKRNTVYNKKAIGAKVDDTFESLTDYLYGISDQAHRNEELSGKLTRLTNDLSSVKPSDGGFLVPEILRADLLRLALERAVVRSRARVIPMDSLTVSFPTVDQTSNVSSVFGGVIGYWTEEGATLQESQPRFGRVKLEAHKLVLYTEVPDELLRDSQPSMEAFISDIFPEALAWYEDVAFFIGGGVGEPLGFLNAPATISVTRSTTVAGSNVEWVDIANMYSRMLPQSLDRAVWIVSPEVLPSLLTMELPGNVAPVMINTNGGQGAPVMNMLGAPIIVSEKARQVGTAGDINFVDFGFYLIGDRQAMTAKQSEDYKFQNDVTAFKITERLDGRPWLKSAITPQNNGDTLSPFVNLTTAV